MSHDPSKTEDRSRRVSKAAAGALTAAVGLAAAAPASAQLVPERLYYGKDRTIPMEVQIPDGVDGEASVLLFEVGRDSETASASVAEGRVDLASLFPSLWETEDPQLLYAQLKVGEERVGAPVVLQPMVTPGKYRLELDLSGARLDPNTGQIDPRSVQRRRLEYQPGGQVYSGIRAYVDRHVVLETSKGEVEFRMRPDVAPNTAWNFMHLVDGGFYTDVIFHRIVLATQGGHPFVVQVGDPTGTGSGGPGYHIDLERSDLPHDFGVLSMARSQDPNSNGSQVFICLSREGTSFLDGQYTGFAQAVRGADVIVAISEVPTDRNDRPEDPPLVERARLIDAPPFGEAPEPVKRPESDSERRGR